MLMNGSEPLFEGTVGIHFADGRPPQQLVAGPMFDPAVGVTFQHPPEGIAVVPFVAWSAATATARRKLLSTTDQRIWLKLDPAEAGGAQAIELIPMPAFDPVDILDRMVSAIESWARVAGVVSTGRRAAIIAASHGMLADGRDDRRGFSLSFALTDAPSVFPIESGTYSRAAYREVFLRDARGEPIFKPEIWTIDRNDATFEGLAYPMFTQFPGLVLSLEDREVAIPWKSVDLIEYDGYPTRFSEMFTNERIYLQLGQDDPSGLRRIRLTFPERFKGNELARAIATYAASAVLADHEVDVERSRQASAALTAPPEREDIDGGRTTFLYWT